jgi:predicted deacylase
LGHSFVIGDRSVNAGERALIDLPVTVGLNGSQLSIAVHVVQGVEPGPTVCLLSTLHGGEWFSVAALRRLAASVQPDALRGTLLIVPVANPPALARQSRNTPGESDSPDMNRIFPGPLTWTSDQLVAAIAASVVDRSDCLLDFHMGPWGSAFQDILIGNDFPDGVAQEAERLALAFGSPIIRRANVVTGFPGPKSSIGYAGGVRGVPALGVEVGGAGFGPTLEERWLKSTVDGCLAVFGALGMIDHAPDPRPARQLVYRRSHRVNPSVGGILRSRFAGSALAAEVAAGTVLGEVQSPYTGEVIEELRAPVDGLLFYVARDHPIHPGGWAFGVAALDDSARWVNGASASGVQ